MVTDIGLSLSFHLSDIIAKDKLHYYLLINKGLYCPKYNNIVPMKLHSDFLKPFWEKSQLSRQTYYNVVPFYKILYSYSKNRQHHQYIHHIPLPARPNKSLNSYQKRFLLNHKGFELLLLHYHRLFVQAQSNNCETTIHLKSLIILFNYIFYKFYHIFILSFPLYQEPFFSHMHIM